MNRKPDPPIEKKPGSTGGTDKEKPHPTTTILRRSRIIRTSPDTLAMTFITPPEGGDRIRFGLRAAGEQYQRNEERIAIKSVVQRGDIMVQATLQDGDVVITAPPNSPVNLTIDLWEKDTKYHSYRLASKKGNE